MPAIKAKMPRLIDILGAINENEIVVVTYNHGRTTYSNTAGMVEQDLKRELSTTIIGMTCDSGAIHIYL